MKQIVETMPGILCPGLSTSEKGRHRHTQENPTKGHKDYEEIEERLKDLRLFSLENERLRESSSMNVYKYLKGGCKDHGIIE